MKSKIFKLLTAIILLSLIVLPVSAKPIHGNLSTVSSSISQAGVPGDGAILLETDDQQNPSPRTSHRLIVELDSPPLSTWARSTNTALLQNGKVNFDSSAAQGYVFQLKAEQAAFVNNMATALPGATVSQYINEIGARVNLSYQVTFNGMAIDPGETSTEEARKLLVDLPGVKAVYLDYAHDPDLYASIPLINAAAAWNNIAIGGMANAGAGIKVASMDGGLHHDAPMFDGTGYSYPPGYPAGGLGLTANNNGKIIASRVYFRTWDPPSAGDENPWPGTQGTPHGNHTASTAAGNQVVADYLGITETISGVAPKAWLMSYRVFYNSITNDGSFYTAEGIAALEDIMMDGADVLNNSWGGGPGSVGGVFDPLDHALINVANAGTFVSMSAGNAGPGNGTTDHPSDEYINVAASTTDGTLASGRLNVTAPEPVTDTLKGISFGLALFGDPLPVGEVIPYNFTTAVSEDPANFDGCDPWTGTPFTGNAVLISRGTCNFSQKVFYAQEAGAEFAVIYNHLDDSLLNMSPGDFADQVTISSIFIGKTDGENMVAWYDTHGAASELELDTLAFQAGNTPDIIANFSSRGPGVGNVLKPDITAPGVNILAQGYAPGVTGEARHLGFGQASGTSMAAPHVAGSAALLRQIHPSWSNAEIKSALMSTSKYIGIWNGDGSHAQPLDMGAGRLDLTNAADPGVILDPPSLSFAVVPLGDEETIDVTVTSVAGTSETYLFETQMISGTYPVTPTISSLPGFTVSPANLTLDPGESATVSVTFLSTAGTVGDNQGYILLDGTDHDAHMPAWARVTPEPSADVLIIDNDFSYLLGFPDYLSYYTDTLDNLGISYDIWDADTHFDNPTTLPDPAVLMTYKAVIYFTGDNFYSDGSFTVSTPLTALDQDILTEYANNGGILIAMGQDMAAVLDSDAFDDNTFFYSSVLGGNFLQDSVTGFDLPTLPVVPRADTPEALKDVSIDLSGSNTAMVTLTGANEVPPVATTTQGVASFAYNNETKALDYAVTIMVTDPLTITASHIHTGTVGVNGGVLYPLFTTPTLVTDTLTFDGSVNILEAHEDALLDGDLYINVHSVDNIDGEIRAQVDVAVNGDGAGNQFYIDEIETYPNQEPDGTFTPYPYVPLLKYPGPNNLEEGTVAMAHRDQPSLERPGITYRGRSIYTTFGLEGVNNGTGATTREELLGGFLDWAMDVPTVVISDVTTTNASNLTMFEAVLDSNIEGTEGVTYRWDFGDGSEFTPAYESNQVGHTYAVCGNYTVRVEATDSWGNVAIRSYEAEVSNCEAWLIYLPEIYK